MSNHTPAVSLSELQRWGGSFPGEHEYSTLGGLRQEKGELNVFFEAAKHLVENWQGNKFAGLWLYGAPGTGKTHAAIGLGRALHDAGAEVHYRFAQGYSFLNEKNFDRQRSSNDVKHQGRYSSIFPHDYTPQAERNPKTVMIIDDYWPGARDKTIGAISAAAHFGGLVVVTSNHPDPFRLLEAQQPVKTDEQAITHEIAERVAPRCR